MSVFEKNMWEIHDMAQKVRDLGAKAFSYNWVDDFGRGRDIVHPTKDAEQHRKFMEYEQHVIDEFKDLIPIIPYEKTRGKLRRWLEVHCDQSVRRSTSLRPLSKGIFIGKYFS